jgi:V/A-type H+-transporting ATPase subunit D
MPKIILSKNELKKRREDLKRYNRYLPALHLKKKRLEGELQRVQSDLAVVREALSRAMSEARPWAGLFNEATGVEGFITLDETLTSTDNVAGVDIPVFMRAVFDRPAYDLFAQPPWVDAAVEFIERALTLSAREKIFLEERRLLSEELRITSQRVNLFEKVLIPRAARAIKRITVHLGDRQTTAVVWARMAGAKAGGSRLSIGAAKAAT